MRPPRSHHRLRRPTARGWALRSAAVVAGLLAVGAAVAPSASASVVPVLPVLPVVPVPVLPGQPTTPQVPVAPTVPTNGRLCADTGAIVVLVVTRIEALPQNHLSFSFPAKVLVDAPGARAVARALCRLPAAPRVPVACPADFGIIYRLTFSSRAGPIATVTAQPSGCEGVGGGGLGARTATSAFWTTLGRAMGLGQPGPATFRGTGPG